MVTDVRILSGEYIRIQSGELLHCCYIVADVEMFLLLFSTSRKL